MNKRLKIALISGSLIFIGLICVVSYVSFFMIKVLSEQSIQIENWNLNRVIFSVPISKIKALMGEATDEAGISTDQRIQAIVSHYSLDFDYDRFCVNASSIDVVIEKQTTTLHQVSLCASKALKLIDIRFYLREASARVLRDQLATLTAIDKQLIALKSGSLDGIMRVQWKDGEIVILPSEFSLKNILGEVNGFTFENLSLNVEFSKKLTMLMLSLSSVHLDSLIRGVTAKEMSIKKVKIEWDSALKSIELVECVAQFLEGKMYLPRFNWRLGEQSNEGEVQWTDIPLTSIAEIYTDKKLQLSGILNMELSVYLNEANQIVIPNAEFFSDGGGKIAVKGTFTGPLQSAGDILENLHFTSLNGKLSMQKTGDFLVRTKVVGFNPNYQNGRTVDLNLTVEENLYSLLNSIRIKNNIEEAVVNKYNKGLTQ